MNVNISYKDTIENYIKLLTPGESMRLSIKQLAAALKINRSFLSRKFSQENGYTLTCYLNQLKNKICAEEQIADGIAAKVMKKLEKAGYRELAEITEKSLAKDFNVAGSFISRKFKQKYHFNLNGLLRKLKMEKAALLLKKHPAMHIEDIVCALGFHNRRHFNKIFKLQFGCPPGIFKKQ